KTLWPPSPAAFPAASCAEAVNRPARVEVPTNAAVVAPALRMVRRDGVGDAGEEPWAEVMNYMTLSLLVYHQLVTVPRYPIEGGFHGRFIFRTPAVPAAGDPNYAVRPILSMISESMPSRSAEMDTWARRRWSGVMCSAVSMASSSRSRRLRASLMKPTVPDTFEFSRRSSDPRMPSTRARSGAP